MINEHNVSTETKELDTSKPGFIFTWKRVLLTYKTHLPKKQYIKYISEKYGKPIKFIRLAHELGDTTNDYEHTHVVIEFGADRVQISNGATFFDLLQKDGTSLHPHIRGIRPGANNLKRVKEYIAKEDPDNADLKGCTKSLVEKVWLCDSRDEMLKMVQKPSDVMGLKQLWDMRPEINEDDRVIITDSERRPWMDIFDSTCKWKSNRTINWLYDAKGGEFKSKFAASKEDEGHDWITFSALGKTSDFLNNLKQELDNGWNKKGIILDLPRKFADKDYIYTILEYCVNGRANATKYQGGKLRFGQPIIWVFSNELPELFNSKLDNDEPRFNMSIDRWHIVGIKPEKNRYQAREDFKHIRSSFNCWLKDGLRFTTVPTYNKVEPSEEHLEKKKLKALEIKQLQIASGAI